MHSIRRPVKFKGFQDLLVWVSQLEVFRMSGLGFKVDSMGFLNPTLPKPKPFFEQGLQRALPWSFKPLMDGFGCTGFTGLIGPAGLIRLEGFRLRLNLGMR